MEVTKTNITKRMNVDINLKLPKNKIEDPWNWRSYCSGIL
jgi:hypothetical protein